MCLEHQKAIRGFTYAVNRSKLGNLTLLNVFIFIERSVSELIRELPGNFVRSSHRAVI